MVEADEPKQQRLEALEAESAHLSIGASRSGFTCKLNLKNRYKNL